MDAPDRAPAQAAMHRGPSSRPRAWRGHAPGSRGSWPPAGRPSPRAPRSTCSSGWTSSRGRRRGCGVRSPSTTSRRRSRSRSRPSTPTTCRRGSPRPSSRGAGPDIIMMLHNWRALARAVSPTSATWPTGRPATRAATTRTPAPRQGRRAVAGAALLPEAPLIAYRKSWFAEVGANQAPKTLEGTRRSAPPSRRRASRSARQLGHLRRRAGVDVSVRGRSGRGDGRQRQEGRARLQGHGRGGDLDDRLLEAGVRRGARWPGTTPTTTAPWPARSAPPERRLDLHLPAPTNPDKVKNDKGEPMWPDIGHFAIPDSPGERRPTRWRSPTP